MIVASCCALTTAKLTLPHPQVLDDDGKKQRFKKVIVKHQLMAESAEAAMAEEEEQQCGRGRRGDETTNSRQGSKRPKAWSKSKLRISDADMRLEQYGGLHV